MRPRTLEEKRVIAALILFTVAIVGYLAGHGRATAAPVENTREASNAVTTLNYASNFAWYAASAAPRVPGLSIAQPLVLAPNGDGADGGLIVGQLLDGESSPLPPQLLAHLRQLPNTDVVDFSDTQAYRYSPLSVTGSRERLALYTIPNSATGMTAVVCYASAGFPGYMRACERLVATLTIQTGKPQVEVRNPDPLTPDAAYGRHIAAVIARVDALLLALRPEIHSGVSRDTVASLANRAAEGLTGAVKSLSALRSPLSARRVHIALSESLAQARVGYSALGAAVSTGDAAAYAAARAQVYSAEAGLSTALRDFTLLGYQ